MRASTSCFAVVDVRDVAAAHRLAMEGPEAAGNRYISAGEHMWMGEMPACWRPRGNGCRRAPLPYWLMWVIARVDKAVRLALGYVGVPALVSADKAKRELGWTTRPARESIVDTAASLLRYGIIDRAAATRTRPGAPT